MGIAALYAIGIRKEMYNREVHNLQCICTKLKRCLMLTLTFSYLYRLFSNMFAKSANILMDWLLYRLLLALPLQN